MDDQYRKDTVEHYDKLADEFSYRNSVTIYGREYGIFFDLLPEGSSIIEIGCGIGRDALRLVEKYQYTGIDASKGMLDIAKKNIPQANFQLVDFYHLDFPSKSFDGFWAAASLLHVPKNEIVLVLKSIRKIIKDNGIGFVSLKLKDSLDEGVIKENKKGIPTKRYFAFYEGGEFNKLLEQSGFEIIEETRVREENDVNKQVWLCYFVRAKAL
ncbi:methyltransferase domain-containing protein [Candidatus Parcubacteria bacterium]|nr:methyltransferase domain-containing protein [Candidatus Parcubacteria bacterium]